MSLIIKLEKVYTTSQVGQEKVNLPCLCKCTFRQSFQMRNLKWTTTNEQPLVKVKRRKRGERRNLMIKKDSHNQDDGDDDDPENRKLLERSNEPIVFPLGEEIIIDDHIEIECFRKATFSKKYALI